MKAACMDWESCGELRIEDDQSIWKSAPRLVAVSKHNNCENVLMETRLHLRVIFSASTSPSCVDAVQVECSEYMSQLQLQRLSGMDGCALLMWWHVVSRKQTFTLWH